MSKRRMTLILSPEAESRLAELEARTVRTTRSDEIRRMILDLEELEQRRADSYSLFPAMHTDSTIRAERELADALSRIEDLRAQLVRQSGHVADRILVFVCHASEDAPIAREIAEGLERLRFRVWYDRYSVTIGDSIREKVEQGLRECSFGLALISHAFMGKPWPKYELDGLLARQLGENRKIILPVLHEMNEHELRRLYPALAGHDLGSTADGIGPLLDGISKAIAATGPHERDAKGPASR